MKRRSLGASGVQVSAVGLPSDLIGRIHDGPFGPSHLRALAAILADLQGDGAGPVPCYSPTEALVRTPL
jgi:ADP-ribosyl-[dinitrogen reductase] hydrolase